jgi:hypothetical protein
MKAALIVISVLMVQGCTTHKKEQLPKGAFALGTVEFMQRKKQLLAGEELTLISRYHLGRNALDGEMSNYFQYQLGKHIKIVSGTDTLPPSLSFYVPLISDDTKEINCKYLLPDTLVGRPKRVIIDDRIMDLNKINISLP